MFPGYVCNWLTEFSKRHGLPHINPHAFRHTQASMLFFNGIDSVSISRRLGHAHMSTTTDIYSHEAKLHWDQGGGGTYQRLCGGCDFETGEGEIEGSRGLRESNNQKWDAFPLRCASHSFYQYCFTFSLDSLSDNWNLSAIRFIVSANETPKSLHIKTAPLIWPVNSLSSLIC